MLGGGARRRGAAAGVAGSGSVDRTDAAVSSARRPRARVQVESDIPDGAAPARRARPVPTLMQRAVRLLARREHSRAELRNKLLRHLPPEAEPESVEQVLDRLVARDMLSEARFVQSRLRVRAGRYGVARLREELRQHDLAPELLRDVLKPLAESEFERAWALWKRKFGVPPADPSQRARQMRFLAGRGFGTDTVLRVIRKARAEPR